MVGQSKESQVDVLVIGAGPAGLMASTAFAQAGVNFRVIDKRPKHVAAGQADGIQPRTIEVFQSYGLAERLFREGNQMTMAAFYNPSPNGGIVRDGRAPDVTATNARYPFKITLNQGAIEAVYLDAMREHGVEVDRPMEPVGLSLDDNEGALNSSDSYPVKVTLNHLDAESGDEQTEIVRAKYVLGTDGAHSWVRKQLGFTMDGEQTDYVWGVVDIIPETDFPDIRNKTAIHSHNGSCMIVPREGDVVRLYIQLSGEDAKEVMDARGRVDKTKWTPQRLVQVAQKTLYPYTIEIPEKVEWWALYIIGQRVASSYSMKDRIFIAGDACHTHSPKAGQGMNAAINDTHNLAWKLAYVLRGWANSSILSTYEFERRKYAQDLIDFDKRFSALFSGKNVSHEDFLEAFQTNGGFTSGIGIQYKPSLITDYAHQELATNLGIGTRLPPQVILRAADARSFELQDLIPSDTRYKILVFTGDLDGETQRLRLETFSREATSSSGFLIKHGRPSQINKALWGAVFDVLTIVSGKKEKVDYTCVPSVLRPHWSKVYLDDIAVGGGSGGTAYASYGISPDGAIVVVRPDGYVAAISSLDDVQSLNTYFGRFLKP